MAGIDLADPDLFATTGGLEELRALQRNCPIYWNSGEPKGFWALTRYADVVWLYRNRRQVSSQYGIHVGQLHEADQPARGRMLVQSDRRTHSRMKAALSRAMTPQALAFVEEPLAETARTVVDDALQVGKVDFTTAVATRMTLTLTGLILGIPAADREQVSQWTAVAFGSSSGPLPATEPNQQDVAEANAELFLYFRQLLHRPGTGKGVLARLRADRQEDVGMEQILYNAHLLLAGGHETTRQALVGAASTFIAAPDQWQRLRTHRHLLPDAVEEVLRVSAPSLNVMRTAIEDLTIGGTTIRAGERITAWHPIANRDPGIFSAPDRIDIGRQPNHHLSFGMGSHHCLGAWLARLTLTCLLDAMAQRVTQLHPAGPGRRSRSLRTWGYDYLPVTLLG
ncbi:cytochrome P450 (plasmid) [Actinacidiphila glaucinigra]|uniref:cytochrome P450 n=1 Tax=Actinacidiphila glaucinigra TaxID=235986 RepID=UPI002DDA4BE2|nr:cytochrome P450 [Actinacidiphila glaucinigra]WSD65825.1 cytochrome P450 [Actinacidiphila glaucinigra]